MVAKPYEAFLASKRVADEASGVDASPGELSPALFDWQSEIVMWALRRGRAAILASTGLGKTGMQLAWADRAIARDNGTQGTALIVTPLAVAQQTVREADKFMLEARHIKDGTELQPGINVTNVERLHRFDAAHIDALVLDESSILKSMDGPTRRALIEFGTRVPLRLACTATPAPNDWVELGSHAEFLGVMTQKEMLSLFYTQDGNSTQKWRLKGHARNGYWEWVASWAVAIRSPADLGYEAGAFNLPPLNTHQRVVEAHDPHASGTLFHAGTMTLQERRNARSGSVEERAQAVANLVAAEPDEPWVIWCGLNAESALVTKLIPGAVEVTGSDTPEHKERSLLGFADGDIRVLVTKPTIAGFGMNWQRCARVAFLGLSDSWEQLHQAVRRCWRFGQTRPVEAYIVTSDAEGAVVDNIARKEQQAAQMMEEIVSATTGLALGRARRSEQPHDREHAIGDGWDLHLGDCVDVLDEIEDETADLVLFSPPFPGMYVYTDSPRDMGNVSSLDEMVEHYQHLAPKLLRVTAPGRSCCVHLTQVTAQKMRDGYIGIKDFRGRVISAMEDAGWIYYGEVCIDKDPQLKAIRTKDAGLLFKSLATDSARMHMALADYLLQFRRPGENRNPIRAGASAKYNNEHGWITQEEWIEWAAPVWYRAQPHMPRGIRETDVLNVSHARTEQDERHLCPLQLGVIERAVKLWTNPGETVLSPFAGVGSEGVGALRLGRKFVGAELKRSYFEQAKRNLAGSVVQPSLLAPM